MRISAFRKPQKDPDKVSVATTSDEDIDIPGVGVPAKTPSPEPHPGAPHSPRKGAKLGFLSAFGGPLGGSSAEEADTDDGRRLRPVNRKESSGWRD